MEGLGYVKDAVLQGCVTHDPRGGKNNTADDNEEGKAVMI